MTHIHAQNSGGSYVVLLNYTAVKQNILRLIFLIYVTTIQHLNYSGQEFCFLFFLVYDCDTPVTLKQCKGQQTCYELVDP